MSTPMRRHPRRAGLAALTLAPALLLFGCAATDAGALPTPTETDMAALQAESDSSGSTDSSESSDASSDSGSTSVEGEPIAVPAGMPGVTLYGCEVELEHTVNETEFDTQWVWELECRSADPFWQTVAGMDANAPFTKTVDQRSGNADFLTETLHYIADVGGQAADVDLKAFGDATEVEVTYTVTLAKP